VKICTCGLFASDALEKVPQWQFAEVCEADNTDLSNVFQICSSNAFGLASPLVSPKPSGLSAVTAMQNESASFLESVQGNRTLCWRSRKLGPVHTPEHPLMKLESAKIFLPLQVFVTQIPKSDSKKILQKIPA
jgi:hypothetical protein